LHKHVEKRDVSHWKHAVGPGINFSVLAGHALQLSPFAPENPALHLHAVRMTLSGNELAWAGHDTHGEDPLTDLYVLAMHIEHVPPSCPDHPASQTQA